MICQTEFIEFLAELIRIPSVKGKPTSDAPFGQETLDALTCFLNRAQQDGFRTKQLDGYCGWIEFGPEDAPIIAAACHLDVVPVGDWADAFTLKQEGDYLIGRGVSDDKGPAVATYFALKALKDSGYSPKHRLRLILGLDEESGSACLAHYVAVDEIPIAAFTPDADFPVIHAEKGRLGVRIDWQDQSPLTFNHQPVTQISGGTVPNIVPAACTIICGDQETIFTGKAAHGSTPEVGENAIIKALKALEAENPTHPIIQTILSRIGDHIHGEALGLSITDEGTGYLTINLGTLQFRENHGEMMLDIRYPHQTPVETLITCLHQIAQESHGELVIQDISPVLYLPMDHPLVHTLNQVYNTYMNETLKPLAIGGNTYAKHLPNTVGFGAVFHEQDVKMHQTGEQAKLSELMACIDIYREGFTALDTVYHHLP